MDWLYVLMPISGVTIFWPGLIILGLGVGIIGGFFGMGGAWMVTPGLNILGFPMAFAVGTDVAHMAGKSLISTLRHGKFGNVDYKLGLTMLVGTIVGVELGADIVKVPYTGDMESFSDVVSSCCVPVVIAGGERMESTRDVLQMVHDAIKAGGAGISMGRNVFQHPNRIQLVRALRAIVHENATVEEALAIVGE